MQEDYNPYCDECGACGEEGCCTPLMCSLDKECKYRETYMRDLKYGYEAFDIIQELKPELLQDAEILKRLDLIYEKIYK